MGEVTSYKPGTPAWVDLMTTDPEGSRRFYSALFGWDYQIGPAEFGGYAMARLDAHDVAGISGEPAPAGVPTAWTTYMATDDCDAIAARVTDSGGTVTFGPTDIGDNGRMAVALDPGAASFGLWQAGTHLGATLVNVPGAVVWNELLTPDLEAARGFYTAVFGYGWRDLDIGEDGAAYLLFTVDGREVGDISQLGAGSATPTHWAPYFAVAEVDATVATAQREGASVISPALDASYGRYAVLADPQGAVFRVIQP